MMRRSVQIRAMVRLVAGLFVAMPVALWAQGPVVQSIFNSASGETRLAPGTLATLRGTNLAILTPGGFSPGSMLWTELPTVTVGGRPAPVLDLPTGDSGSVEVQLPVELTPGPTTLVVSTSAGTSAVFNLTLEAYSPGLLPGFQRTPPPSDSGSGCYSRAVVAGDLITVYATGLGATNPMIPTGGAAPGTPPASTVTKPVVMVGGHAAEVVESVLSPGTGNIGRYRVTFKMPAASGVLGVVVTIGGRSSNAIPLGAGTAYTSSNFLNVQAASWLPGPSAPETLMVAHSCFPAGLTEVGEQGIAGDSRNPALTLGGATVKVQDSAGVERPAPILYVSSYQANYLIPAGTAMGTAKVTITSAAGRVSTAQVDIQPVAPGIFQAALLTRYGKGFSSTESLWLAISVAEGIGGQLGSPVLDLGLETDDVYLILFGTGLRYRSSMGDVSATFAGVNVPVEYVGAQNEFAGLDQVNLKLPKSIAGLSGPLNLTVNGNTANVAFLTFK